MHNFNHNLRSDIKYLFVDNSNEYPQIEYTAGHPILMKLHCEKEQKKENYSVVIIVKNEPIDQYSCEDFIKEVEKVFTK